MKFGLYVMMIEHHLRKWLSAADVGWGNGYILIPKNHPFYKIHYDDIHINIHGGLTFSDEFNSENFLKWINNRELVGDVTLENFDKFEGYWIIGFDCAHFGDNSFNCSKEYVIEETNDLLEKCLDESIKGVYEYKYIYLRKDKLKKISSLL